MTPERDSQPRRPALVGVEPTVRHAATTARSPIVALLVGLLNDTIAAVSAEHATCGTGCVAAGVRSVIAFLVRLLAYAIATTGYDETTRRTLPVATVVLPVVALLAEPRFDAPVPARVVRVGTTLRSRRPRWCHRRRRAPPIIVEDAVTAPRCETAIRPTGSVLAAVDPVVAFLVGILHSLDMNLPGCFYLCLRWARTSRTLRAMASSEYGLLTK